MTVGPAGRGLWGVIPLLRGMIGTHGASILGPRNQRNGFPQKKQNRLSAFTIVPQFGHLFFDGAALGIVGGEAGAAGGARAGGSRLGGDGLATRGSILGPGV